MLQQGEHDDSVAAPRKLNMNFWKYWLGQTISNLGSSVTLFALPLLVYKLTGSALNLGISTAADMLPYLLFGLLLGAVTDRVDRKRLMVTVDILRALVIATIPCAAFLGWLSVWWIYAAGFVNATLSICFESGQFAAVPNLVGQEDLVTANGRIQASYSAASVLGPFLAGVLVSLMPLASLMFIDAASFLVSAASLLLVAISFNGASEEKTESGDRRRILSDVVEGLRYVWQHPVLRNISLMMALVNFVSTTFGSQQILFVKERFHATDLQTSLMYTASSIGVVVISLGAGYFRKRWSFSRVALTALVLDGLFVLLVAFSPWYWFMLLCIALSAGCGILFNINTGSLRQAIVPNHMLGRVMSIAGVLAWSAIPLGALLGGWVINLTGDIRLVYTVIGILVTLIPICFSFTALGHADRYLPAAMTKMEAGAE